LINSYKNGDLKYQSIETSDVKVHVYGGAAVVTYAAQVKELRMAKTLADRFA